MSSFVRIGNRFVNLASVQFIDFVGGENTLAEKASVYYPGQSGPDEYVGAEAQAIASAIRPGRPAPAFAPVFSPNR